MFVVFCTPLVILSTCRLRGLLLSMFYHGIYSLSRKRGEWIDKSDVASIVVLNITWVELRRVVDFWAKCVVQVSRIFEKDHLTV